MLNRRAEYSLYREFLTGSKLYVSFQTVAEMRYGGISNGWGTAKRKELSIFLGGFEVVGYSSDLADCWATIRHQSSLAGKRLEIGDSWVGAAAMYLKIPLLTHDKDFIDLPNIHLQVIHRAL